MAGSELTPAQRLVLYYMAFEALYNSRTWLTFDDIKKGTGLSTRALRGALVKLRELGYVASIMDPARGRKLLHRVLLDRICPSPELEGLYLIDVSGDLTPDAVKILSNADVVLYTPSVDPKRLEGYAKKIQPFKGEVPKAKLVAVAFNPVLDDIDALKGVVQEARYVCASNAVDKALGSCLACGLVDVDYGAFRIKAVKSEGELEELAKRYEIRSTLVLQTCDGKKLELVVLKRRGAPSRQSALKT
ncbi:MAG: helix-turn-helix domain-containing protein [Thermoproteus sp.]